MKQWKNRGFRKFSILSFILVVFLLSLKTGEILALEIKIIPFGISKNKGGIEANIISSESKGDIAIPKFNRKNIGQQGKKIESLEIIGKSDLPSKVLQTFKREISKVLLEQGFSREISESF